MAPFLKIKLFLISCSVLILAFIPLSEHNFYKKATIKRWQELSWDDFQGFQKPFTRFDAGISSNVYLEFDSSLQQYIAYAGQNNQKSYKKTSSISDNLLKHEQYHFNITEVHARIMNQYLENNFSNSEGDHLNQLQSVKNKLSHMQNKYDQETNHSLKHDMQSRWEFKIDSMLHTLSNQPPLFVDSLTGATVFFPGKPLERKEFPEDNYNTYSLHRYEMDFELYSAQVPVFNMDTLKENLSTYYNKDSLTFYDFRETSTNYEYELFVELIIHDSQMYVHQNIIYHRGYLYILGVQYPTKTLQTTGYRKNALSYINSFKIDEDLIEKSAFKAP